MEKTGFFRFWLPEGLGVLLTLAVMKGLSAKGDRGWPPQGYGPITGKLQMRRRQPSGLTPCAYHRIFN